MADITTVYLPVAFHLTPSRGLTLIKQVVPVHWPTALELRGGGTLQHFFLRTPPSPYFHLLSLHAVILPASSLLAQTAGNSSKFKDPAGT